MSKNIAIGILLALVLVLYSVVNAPNQISENDAFKPTLASVVAHAIDESERNAHPVEPIKNEQPRCNPNYSGCLKPDASDYDCAGGSGNGPYYTGRVQVIGYDQYGLDRNHDGWGCE